MSTEIRGRIVSASIELDDGVISVRGERIASVTPFVEWSSTHRHSPEPQFSGTILPGLVDLHNHGGLGHRFDSVDHAQARAAASYHHATGTTTLLASVVTGPVEEMVAQIAMLGELAREGVLAGIHAEGPFLSHARCGAQDPRFLHDPDPATAEQLLAAGGGQLRVMTLAPERPGYAALARQLAERGVVVALGHSDADFATFSDALRPKGSGGLVTHLANGMPPTHHRAPGPVAASLVAAAAGNVTVELINDGVHVDPGFAALVFAAAPDRVALITDAMQAAGLSDGEYRLGPQAVTVRDGVARIANGSIAGGVSTLLSCLARTVRESGIPLRAAVRAATSTPAAVLGRTDIGDLRPGQYADLLIVGDNLQLRRVLRRGSLMS
ncbi:N-acetylglucosamine-6-phosphate deacetylase [Nocardia callitridis]|uniref:N-acetylglucosamine-6-phosphate deacetylase n=1 Tax=Nocardia callitridis TaxID=648753 RepID=A0ABP9K0U5_9NOCA